MMRASKARPMTTLGKPPFSPVKEMSPRSNPSSPASVGSAKKFHPASLGGSVSPPPVELEDRWEVRPGGMLVQRRDPDAADTVATKPMPPPIRVRVKYGEVYHEVFISPEASFGELKKLLSVQTGLHPQEQKLMYKDKERDSASFLDTSGVKDKSKLVLLEDATAKAKRFLEIRKNAKMEKAAKAVAAVTADVDRLAKQVSLVESIVGRGKKVAENDVLGLIDQLMNQLLKLDAVVEGEDNVKQQKKTQIQRVQKYVEALDVIKVKNSNAESPRTPLPLPQQKPRQQQHQQQQYYPQQNSRNPYLDHHLPTPPVNHPNQLQQLQVQKPLSPASSQLDLLSSPTWEPFDLLSSAPSTSHASCNTTTTTASSSPTSAGSTAPAATAFASPVSPVPIARFEWELF